VTIAISKESKLVTDTAVISLDVLISGDLPKGLAVFEVSGTT
jgi:hypothetical protein